MCVSINKYTGRKGKIVVNKKEQKNQPPPLHACMHGISIASMKYTYTYSMVGGGCRVQIYT